MCLFRKLSSLCYKSYYINFPLALNMSRFHNLFFFQGKIESDKIINLKSKKLNLVALNRISVPNLKPIHTNIHYIMIIIKSLQILIEKLGQSN